MGRNWAAFVTYIKNLCESRTYFVIGVLHRVRSVGSRTGLLGQTIQKSAPGPDFAGTHDYMCSVGQVKRIGVAYRYKKSDVPPERA